MIFISSWTHEFTKIRICKLPARPALNFVSLFTRTSRAFYYFRMCSSYGVHTILHKIFCGTRVLILLYAGPDLDMATWTCSGKFRQKYDFCSKNTFYTYLIYYWQNKTWKTRHFQSSLNFDNYSRSVVAKRCLLPTSRWSQYAYHRLYVLGWSCQQQPMYCVGSTALYRGYAVSRACVVALRSPPLRTSSLFDKPSFCPTRMLTTGYHEHLICCLLKLTHVSGVLS